MRLKDKVCIITGSGNGIGQATALKFAMEGAKVVVSDIDRDATDETLDRIQALGGEAIGYQMDVTNKNQVTEIVQCTLQKFQRIDVLINNAGIIMDGMLTNLADEQFDKVIDVNLKGTYLCTKAVIDIMVSQNYGVVLNASSIVGLYGNVGQTNYAATKSAVIGMTKSWAKELGRKGIRCNVVCPGFIDTPILAPVPEKIMRAMKNKVPLGRLGQPEEVANLYAFLASDEASYINGAIIEVSGGVVI